MENVVVLNQEQFEESIYRAVSRYFDEMNIGVQEKPIEEGYYDRSELREQLHISYPTLWRIEKAGLLDGVKVGRRKLYAKQDVTQLIESGKLANFNDINK